MEIKKRNKWYRILQRYLLEQHGINMGFISMSGQEENTYEGLYIFISALNLESSRDKMEKYLSDCPLDMSKIQVTMDKNKEELYIIIKPE